MLICILVNTRPLCTFCTLRLLSLAIVHLYLSVHSSPIYLLYLETFVLCRCSPVSRCTLVPSVPYVPRDFCTLRMCICTLVYPRPLCTLHTLRILSYVDVHLHLVYPRPFCTLCTFRLLSFADVLLYLCILGHLRAVNIHLHLGEP